MNNLFHPALTEPELREVKGGTGTTPPLPPRLGVRQTLASAKLPVLPGVPPWIEQAIGSWAGSLALEYAQALLIDSWEHRVESSAQALPPMAMRPLAERTHRWLN